MQLSVIIVSFNAGHFLLHCLSSVMRAMADLHAEVIVVDNASADRSIASVTTCFPTVQVIRNEKNVGFSKANNIGLQYASGKYVLFLNPDTIVSSVAIKRAMHEMERNDRIGACGVQMIDGSGAFLPESKRSFPTLLNAFFKLSGIAACFPASSFFNAYALGALNKDDDHDVEVLTGAFMMCKRELISSLGGFDELFFMYGEDIDLCYRIRQTGHRIRYLGSATIIHFKGECTDRSDKRYTERFYGAMRMYVNKHNKGAMELLLLKTAILIGQCFQKRTKRITSSFNRLFVVREVSLQLDRLLSDNNIIYWVVQPQVIRELKNEYIVLNDRDTDQEQMISFCKLYTGRLRCAFFNEQLGSMIISTDRSNNGRVITTAKPVAG